MIQVFIFFISIYFSIHSRADQSYVWLLGAGGDQQKVRQGIDPFEYPSAAASSLMKSHPAYNIQISYGEPSDEDKSVSMLSNQLQSLFMKPENNDSHPRSCCAPFTKDSFEAQLNDYIEKIESGKLSSKDQLTIVLQSHGAYPKEGSSDHQILYAGSTLKEFNKEEGHSPKVSVTALRKLQEVAKRKRVPLAILDMSCFSGLSIELLKDDHTCLISAAAPDDFAYNHKNSFSVNLWKAMKNSNNLEDAFLKARLKNDDPAFPMIGSPEAESFQLSLKKILTPYLRYNASGQNIKTLQNSLFSHSNKEVLCELSDSLTKLRSWSKSLTNEILISKLNKLDAKLQDYLKFQVNLVGRYESAVHSKFFVENKSKKIEVCISSANCRFYTLEQMMNSDFSKAIESLSQIDTLKKVVDDSQMTSDQLRQFFQVAQSKKERLLNQYQELREIDSIYQGMSEKDEKESYNKATEIAQLSVEIYQLMYEKSKGTSDRNSSVKNPCREFRLPQKNNLDGFSFVDQ